MTINFSHFKFGNTYENSTHENAKSNRTCNTAINKLKPHTSDRRKQKKKEDFFCSE